ncbi:O-antigen ligase family protein [Devosia sp. A369]
MSRINAPRLAPPRSQFARSAARPPRATDRPVRAPRIERRRDDIAAPDVQTTRLAWPVIALCWSLIIPWIIPLGSLAMQPYRMVLIVVFFPALFRLLSGKAGRIGIADIATLGFSCWISVALFVAHGFSGAVEQAGSEVLETMGAYMVARAYIRSARDYEALARLLFIIVGLVLFPLALLEVATGRNIVLELASRVLPTHIINYQPPRLGIRRVQSVFEHPILFGVFCSGALAMTYIVRGYAKTMTQRVASTGVVAITAFLSMSSGPMSTVMAQIMLLIWDKVFRKLASRWWLLIGIVASSALVVDLFSNRSLPAILFSYFALDEASAYFRLLIWEFGSQSVLNHPIFGVGMGEWDRPSWMPFSVDMFWLVNAIVGGIPAAFFMALAFFATTLSVTFATGLDGREEQCRLAYLITMSGFFFAGWMVHFWGATYVLFILLLGSGRWMADSFSPRSSTIHPAQLRT